MTIDPHDLLQRRSARIVEEIAGQSLTDQAHIETIYGRRQVAAALRDLHRMARQQVRAFHRPSYLLGPATGRHQPAVVERERMAAGVPYRALYECSVFGLSQGPAAFAHIEHGEQARVLRTLPMELVIADEDRALVVLGPGAAPEDAGNALHVRRSRLLTLMTGMFEAFWEAAVPVACGGQTDLSRGDRAILTMMACGHTDKAIAYELHISVAIVVRRRAGILRMLGTTSGRQRSAANDST